MYKITTRTSAAKSLSSSRNLSSRYLKNTHKIVKFLKESFKNDKIEGPRLSELQFLMIFFIKIQYYSKLLPA